MASLRVLALPLLTVVLAPVPGSVAQARPGATPWAARAAPTSTTVDIADYVVFFGNLHSHTAYSDGSGTPKKAFDHARKKGRLDFLFVTEHSHGKNIHPKGGGPAHGKNIAQMHDLYDGSAASSLISTARAKTDNGQFLALYGQEWSTISSGNHMLVLDAPHVIDAPSGNVRELVETWLPANLDSTGNTCVMQMNHPWLYPQRGQDPTKEYGGDDWPAAEFVRAVDAHVQLIEVMNGPSHSQSDGERPGKVDDSEYRHRLAEGFHLAPTADQDNHYYT